MMKRSLIKEGINALINPQSKRRTLLSRFLTKVEVEVEVTLRIKAPKYFFLRADVFLDDVNRLTRGSLPQLEVGYLIYLLYENFLEKIRRGVDLHKYLIALQKNSKEFLKPPPELEKRDENHWVLGDGEGEKRKRGMAALMLTMKRSSALRGEVFLYDLQEYDPNFKMGVEELISLLFIEFISGIRNGNIEKVVAQIVNFLDAHQDEDEY
ncbi:hypothetical protein J2T17_004400 [Paenibacillus mucilaginosus]|uniref:hypothetical protein n=1 Tax=Paenibacillus mucilaginosus TaxID=61624 RepID=UPI003D1FECE6